MVTVPTLTKETRASKRRELLWAATDGRCWYCGDVIHGPQRTIDHVVPRCQGGTRAGGNAVPCCLCCNERKSDLDIETFREHEARRQQWPYRTRYPFAFELEGWVLP